MKRYSVIVFALLGCAFVCALAAALMLFVRDNTASPYPSSTAESYVGGYLLTLYDGFVAIKQLGEDKPCKIYSTPETMLSVYDRELLNDGIYCATLQEAMRSAEDFIG